MDEAISSAERQPAKYWHQLDDGRILYRSQEARTLFGDTVYAREHYVSKEARDRYVSALKKKSTVTDMSVIISGPISRYAIGPASPPPPTSPPIYVHQLTPYLQTVPASLAPDRSIESALAG